MELQLLVRPAATAPSSARARPSLRLPAPAAGPSRPRRPGFPTLRAAAAAAAAIAAEPETKEQQQNSIMETEVFACPVCYEPLMRKGPPGINLPAIYRSGFKCSKCNKSFTSKDYFQPVAGGILLDVSCGSGLFTRKFAKSGTYSAVIALDFSENMLRQCYEFIKQDDTLLNANLALVRADISRLPFASCSVDAIHAGAAIHCWPSPSNAVAEISRVLRPGGVFVGTTFLSSPRNNPFSVEALRPLRQIVGPVNTSYNYFTEGELEDLCKSCGLVNYSSKVQRSFIMFSGQKPY
ncbi:hypothetical protein BDA96_10G269200 [Sorghum bicolor]|uniref:Methyltransferase type 11 domain-containing protein n=1 Tax=Sorghum bicolor TaxID=4558 RepID=A0A921Q5E8_SORBI|nr:hypothetical protein BDA96_10G269200 [Sorghum bicolor]